LRQKLWQGSVVRALGRTGHLLRADEMGWNKSSFSAYNGNCVEWHKSTFSNMNGNCAEIAGCKVRDSKDPQGPVLEFSEAGWTEFLEAVKNNEFNIGC
jgi:hypothetical protein